MPDPAVFKSKHSLRLVGEFHVVGHHHECCAQLLVEIKQKAFYFFTGFGIEIAGWLIGQNDRRAGDQSPGHGNLLLLAAGSSAADGRVVNLGGPETISLRELATNYEHIAYYIKGETTTIIDDLLAATDGGGVIDFVEAFAGGGFEVGPRPGGPNPVMAVPEPSSALLAGIGSIALLALRRRRNS